MSARVPKLVVEVVALRQPRPPPTGGQARCAVSFKPSSRKGAQEYDYESIKEKAQDGTAGRDKARAS